MEDTATRVVRLEAERGSPRLAVLGVAPLGVRRRGEPRAFAEKFKNAKNKICVPRVPLPVGARVGRRRARSRVASARAREKYGFRRDCHAGVSFVGISIEGLVRTAATFMSQPSLSSPSVKLAYPRVASCASSSSAICSRLFWFFQSPSPPPLPRRCACPLPRPASPYMFPLERPPVFPLNAGWPPGAPMARVRTIEGKAETEFVRPPEARAPRNPRRSPCARSPRL